MPQKVKTIVFNMPNEFITGTANQGEHKVMAKKNLKTAKPAASARLRLDDRILGSLIGAAVGDALGAPCECLHYQRILKEYGDFQGFADLVAVKAGWLPLGGVTDDTVLADLLIDTILENDGVLDAHLFAKQWESFEKPIANPDGGDPINRLNKMHWIERIPYLRNNLREINKRELGHGEANATNAVMYIGPVGLLCAGDPNKAAVMAADVTSVNQHGAPRDVGLDHNRHCGPRWRLARQACGFGMVWLCTAPPLRGGGARDF